MTDMTIRCVICGNNFFFSERDQEFFTQKGFAPPKRCRPCRIKREANGNVQVQDETKPKDNLSLAPVFKAAHQFIDAEGIYLFVKAVEDTKKFRRDVRLVFAHLVEEAGELARAIYLHEKACDVRDQPDASGIGDEIIDILFLAVYLAEILGIQLNDQIPDRMNAIKMQYNVK